MYINETRQIVATSTLIINNDDNIRTPAMIPIIVVVLKELVPLILVSRQIDRKEDVR